MQKKEKSSKNRNSFAINKASVSKFLCGIGLYSNCLLSKFICLLWLFIGINTINSSFELEALELNRSENVKVDYCKRTKKMKNYIKIAETCWNSSLS